MIFYFHYSAIFNYHHFNFHYFQCNPQNYPYFFNLAMNNLGICYENGQGVEQNYQKAVEFYQKAADLGDANGISNFNI